MRLVTGANGMVGSYLKDWKHTLLTDKEELDVTKYKMVDAYSVMDLDCIIHLAAETDLEKCEQQPYDAYEVNTIGTFNMLQLAIAKDIPFIYISTAGIFDGTKEQPYTEEDIANPINVYGKSKYYGEEIVKCYPKHYIFRSGWMMGGGPRKEKKFVAKIINKIKNGERELQVINDIYGSPTYAKDLMRAVKGAIYNNIPYGIYNACDSGTATRCDVAKAIVKFMKYPVDVFPVTSEKFLSEDKDHPCKRSSNEMMNTAKIHREGIALRDWRFALAEYLEEWK